MRGRHHTYSYKGFFLIILCDSLKLKITVIYQVHSPYICVHVCIDVCVWIYIFFERHLSNYLKHSEDGNTLK